MKSNVLRLSLLSLLIVFVCAPPCWAKEKGYLFVVGYSQSQKKVFYSSVIMKKIPAKSFSEEEFVADVELIRDMENQFEKFLIKTAWINPVDYTISTRGAYKTEEIAQKLIDSEKSAYINKGYKASVLKTFVYDD